MDNRILKGYENFIKPGNNSNGSMLFPYASGFRDCNVSDKKIFDRLREEINEIDYNRLSVGCGLEDSNITDRYTAAAYGFAEAMSKVMEILEGFYGEI